MILEYATNAKKDLSDIVSYIALDNPFRAQILYNKIEADCEKLLLNAGIFRVVKRKNKIDYRMKVHGNYLIYYSFTDEKLTIHRVIHAARSQRNLFS